jgi:glycerophosphoryl diester phosphodiesterase
MRSIFFLGVLLTVFQGVCVADPSLSQGITAHRGNSGEYPENTLPAFQSAIKMGVDWVELDVHVTKDRVLVVVHDTHTGRVGDRKLVVSEHTYAELKEVDVATEYRKMHGLTLEKCPPQTIPTLEAVLRLFSESQMTKISIQPKADCVPNALEVIRELKLESKVGFNDGNLKYMSEVKKLAPNVPVFWDRPAQSDIDEDIRIARERGFESLVINDQGITKEKIGKVKSAGLEIGAWTVNQPERMKELLAMGIQRIYTDEPAKLKLVKEDPETVFCEGIYRHHLQGLCVDGTGNIYWSWTDRIVKTDAKGKLLVETSAPNHQGDLCVVNDRIFVAVNLGKFNRDDNTADSWVYEFDAKTLQELRRIRVPELVHGAGGIAYRGGRFFVVGGLPPGYADNQIYEYDRDFKFINAHPIQSGYTLMGIQTFAYAHGFWWAGCYGNPVVTLKLNENFKVIGRFGIDTSVGIDVGSGPLYSVGGNFRTAFGKNFGYVRQTRID